MYQSEGINTIEVYPIGREKEVNPMKAFTKTRYEIALATNSDWMTFRTYSIGMENQSDYEHFLAGLRSKGWALLEVCSSTKTNYIEETDCVATEVHIGAYMWKVDGEISKDVNDLRNAI